MARRRMNVGRKIKDEPVKTKTNRGARPERKKARQPAEKMGPPMPTPTGPETPKSDLPKVNMTPTSPTVDASVTPKVAAPPKVTKRPQVTGKGGRNVTREGPMGKRTLANVTREQLTDTGMTLRQYLNYMDKNDGKRPPKKKAPKKIQGSSEMAKKQSMYERKTKKGMMGGGMMKSKMGTKGGAMGGKKKPPGMKKGGKFPDLSGDGKVTQKDILMGKGVIKKKGGGKVKPKGAAGGGYKKGGMKPKTSTKKRVSKAKVRGAGIARKGVRPVKYR